MHIVHLLGQIGYTYRYAVLCLESDNVGIPVILPPISLKNAPSPGLRAHLKDLLFFAVYYHFCIKCNLIKGSK